MFYGNTVPSKQQDDNWLNESFDPNYEETFYNEFYNAYWALNNEIEFQSMLEAEGFELSTEVKQSKGTIGERISKLISTVINWIKEAFKNFLNGVEKVKDKIVNNTFRDKALQKLFNNYSYNDIVIAKEKGWKGVPKSYAMPAMLDIEDDSIYQSFKDYNVIYCKESLNDIVESMETDQTVEHAEESYNKILDLIKEYNHVKSLKFKEWWEQSQSRYGIHLNYDYGTNEDDKYYYPMKQHFEEMQNIVFHSQQKIINIKKSFDNGFKKITKDKIFDCKKELKDINSKEDDSDNQGNKVYNYYLKSKIAVCGFQLQLTHSIMKNYIKTINDTFKYAFIVYRYIVASTKIYLLTDTIKNKVEGKEKKPETAEANG